MTVLDQMRGKREVFTIRCLLQVLWSNVRSCTFLQILRANFGPVTLGDISMKIQRHCTPSQLTRRRRIDELPTGSFQPDTCYFLQLDGEILLTRQNPAVDIDPCFSPSYSSQTFTPANISDFQALISHASHIWSVSLGLLAVISFWTSSGLSSYTGSSSITGPAQSQSES